MMLSHRSLPLVALALLAFSCARDSESEPGSVVSGRPTCSECRIERRLVATINDANYPDGALGLFARVQANSDGSFLVLGGPGTGLFFDAVFLADTTGSITRQIGRVGEGPGEFLGPRFSMETGSSYLIIDSRLRRLTRISKDDLTPEATSRFTIDPQGLSPIAFPNGTLVLATPSGTVTVASPEGEIERTFEIGLDSLTGEGRHPHYLSASGDSTFWVSFRESSQVEKWNLAGKRVDLVERRADWIRPRRADGQAGDEYTEIWGVFEDPPGLLWIQAQQGVLVESKREGRRPDGTRATIRVLGSDPDLATKETRFEVIDLARREALASLVVPMWVAQPSPGSLHFTVIRTPETVMPMIEVWTLDLLR